MTDMYPRIELLWLSETAHAARWAPGLTSRAAPTPWAVARLLERRLKDSDADALLFWDPALGPPDPRQVAGKVGIVEAGVALLHALIGQPGAGLQD